MKNISYLLSLLLVFSYVSFADDESMEAPKDSEEVVEDVEEDTLDEGGEPAVEASKDEEENSSADNSGESENS